MARIAQIRGREILDSRGNPTVEVDVWLEDGALGRASVPSGASTGKAEALELRDGDPTRYHGRGVLKAVENIERTIAPALRGAEASDQSAVDHQLCELDGTENKQRLGANAILGASLAVSRAAAASAGLPLYRYLGGASAGELPVPMVNILSGRTHGGSIDFQDFMVIPLRAQRYSEALENAVAVYRAMKDVLKSRGAYQAGVADEGGYAAKLESNEAGFEVMVEAIERAGFEPGRDAAISLDVAASHLWEDNGYALATPPQELKAGELVAKLEAWVGKYPLLSIEDGLAEEDWEGWKLLTQRLGRRCQLVGDDLFTTNPERLQQGIELGIANAVLVKMNQIGTLTETLDVVRLAKQHGYRTVISARSGETEDDFIADLAVATGAGQIKIGAVTCSERMAKYNRLLRIEEELGARARYRGAEVFGDWLIRG
ncbi:MAG: phosphopyruvate hydratase [Acidobacteriia bacterium]|nr:phosphopyruvate hydratase [Terriglobia bacterium]